MTICSEHKTLIEKIDALCKGQATTAATLDMMAKSLAKLEDANLHLVEIRGSLLEMEKRWQKTERALDEIFTRLREQENVGADSRLKKIESQMGQCPGLKEVKAQQDRILWGGLITIALALLISFIKAIWGKM